MTNIGIIAEYNPFHSGHRHHIAQSKALLQKPDAGVIVMMSGHWVQQANCAIAHKWTRAQLALEGGGDLVLELPTPWATASAQHFARGAVALLHATGIVTHLSFGSESGDLSGLEAINQGLLHPQYPLFLKEALKTGCNFPKARQLAMEQLLNRDCAILSQPNNTLGLEYLSALHPLNNAITPITIPRQGAGFHQMLHPKEAKPSHTSATDLREKLYQGNWAYTQEYLSASGEMLLKKEDLPSLSHCERSIMAKIITMTPEDWAKLPDSGAEEGLPYALANCGKQASSVAEFIQGVKSKRYTHARLRRLVLWAFLGLTQEHIPEKPLYLRVLAMNEKGMSLLHQMKEKATLPILTKPAHIQRLSLECQELFDRERQYTDLYGLCFSKMLPRGLELRQSPVVDFSQ